MTNVVFTLLMCRLYIYGSIFPYKYCICLVNAYYRSHRVLFQLELNSDSREKKPQFQIFSAKTNAIFTLFYVLCYIGIHIPFIVTYSLPNTIINTLCLTTIIDSARVLVKVNEC